MIKIAIFASGSGSNAEEFFKYFKGIKDINIDRVYSNNPNAFVLNRAEKFNIPTTTFSRKEYKEGVVLTSLQENDIDFIVLAGFMWLVPASIVQAFPDRIINIHPALLPKFGGKGMYGMHVHQAVLGANETESGITIHLVNEKYDEGNILFQQSLTINSEETPESLAERIHQLEHKNFPKVVESYIRSNLA